MKHNTSTIYLGKCSAYGRDSYHGSRNNVMSATSRSPPDSGTDRDQPDHLSRAASVASQPVLSQKLNKRLLR